MLPTSLRPLLPLVLSLNAGFVDTAAGFHMRRAITPIPERHEDEDREESA